MRIGKGFGKLLYATPAAEKGLAGLQPPISLTPR